MLRQSPAAGARNPRRILLVATSLCAAGALASGCHRSDAASESDPTTHASGATTATTLELTAGQLNSIKLEPVESSSFPLEFEAVGTVSFDEDPAVIQSEAILISAAASLDMNRKELRRVQSLGEANGIPPKELEGAVAAEQAAAAALKGARDAVRALGKSDAEIDQLVASGRFDALRTDRPVKWVVANVTESESPQVRVGQKVRVKVAAYPETWFEGRLSRIYATIDPNTHRLTVRAQVEDPENELRAGMLASIFIRAGAPIEGIAIPTTAVVREGDGSMIVWVTTDRQHFTERPLKLGLQSGGRYQVLAGLKTGELAVTEGGVFLSNMLEAPPGD
jgi:cobalt-zinc-cadmium efflux system membrane fusion protein